MAVTGKIEIEAQDAHTAVLAMEAYLSFGDKTQWAGLKNSERRFIVNGLRRSINNIKAALLAE